MEQVIDNIRIAEYGYANSLTLEEKNLIQRVKETYSKRIDAGCTSYGYCMPCPSGVDIPLNLSLPNDFYICQNMKKPAGNYYS